MVKDMVQKSFLIVCFIFFLNLFSVHAQWYEPKRVTKEFYADPDIEMDIPSFKEKVKFTSYKEMLLWIEDVKQKHSEVMKVEVIGNTHKGRQIPMITLSKGNNQGKINVFYFARVHGDEPAGTEALLYFVHQLLTNDSLQYLFEKLNFYVIPSLNIDGAESFSRRTATDIDMNRDQSKLQTIEAQILHSIVNKIQPHVAVDFHEYQPMRTDFIKLAPERALATPWDVMLLYSGNPNVPVSLRNIVSDVFLPEIYKILDENKLTHHTYYSSRNQYGHISIPIGGASPRSTSNALALKNIVTLLVETRGIRLGTTSLKRRTYGAYLNAYSIANTAYNNTEKILQAIEDGVNDRSDIAVRFSSKKIEKYELPFLDVAKKEIVKLNVPVSLSTESVPTLTRKMPEAYYLLSTEVKAVEILKNMGVQVDVLSKEETLKVESFYVKTIKESGTSIGGVYPVSVQVDIQKKSVTFPIGTFKISTYQKCLRVPTVLLEPESSNGFVNYRVINVQPKSEIPIYRLLK